MKTHKNNISELQAGNPGFFEELYKFYFKRLRGYAIKFTGDTETAGDIVNECFLKLWKNRKTLQCTNLEGYLFQMVRNQAIDHINVTHHHEDIQQILLHEIQKQEIWEYYNFSHDPESLYIADELKKHIHHITEQLPEPCKTVFLLSRDEGLKNREIAEQLQISIKTVEYHITNALKTLYKELQNKGFSPLERG